LTTAGILGIGRSIQYRVGIITWLRTSKPV
jgi:hypothetical protein